MPKDDLSSIKRFRFINKSTKEGKELGFGGRESGEQEPETGRGLPNCPLPTTLLLHPSSFIPYFLVPRLCLGMHSLQGSASPKAIQCTPVLPYPLFSHPSHPSYSFPPTGHRHAQKRTGQQHPRPRLRHGNDFSLGATAGLSSSAGRVGQALRSPTRRTCHADR